MDPSEYKHVVLGLVFLKYISDRFQARHQELERLAADPTSDWYEPDAQLRLQISEDRDAYIAESIFHVPEQARWSYLQDRAKQPEIGRLLDDAMLAIENDNVSLKGVLPKDYARPQLDRQRLGELVDLIGTIALGDDDNHSRDVLGRVYEYFLGQFATQEGRRGGEFYTPRSIVRLLVEMIQPFHGRVYDPCCGSGGMFVQSERFIEEHGGHSGDLSIYGQESNHTTWRLARMNLAIRGIDANLGQIAADSFHNDLHRDLRADFILANPPFNDSAWGGDRLRDDARWRFGVPPAGNANFAWVQHFIHHLAPDGIAGFVLANGSMSSSQSGEGEIRKAIVDADLVDCMIALPGQLFYGTQIPACLWFLTRDKNDDTSRDRRGETLFMDARKLGVLTDRTHRELTEGEIARIAVTYHAWRSAGAGTEYADIPGFCKSATTAEVAANGHVLTPGRYVGAQDIEDDGEPFEDKMRRLVATLERQFAESTRLEAEIRKNLQGLGHGAEI
ncbi:MAG TPA: class I SAM-dependent DNA methyltransferase [Dehalococcoidia bacterium]|nr:class I SAM-dependent DNA methyltransferase [Dehalococcoidia bacterium]